MSGNFSDKCFSNFFSTYVMPATIAEGHLLLKDTIETTSSEAAGHAEFDN